MIELWPRQRVTLVCSFVLQGGSTLESMGKLLPEAKKENVTKNNKQKQFLCFGVVDTAEGICGDGGE